MRVISYSRVSTAEQAEEGVSLEAQQEKIRQYAELYQLEIVATPTDPGESGKNLKRPGIQKALAMLRNREADGLIVFKLDRLTREPGDWAMLLCDYFCEKAGKRLFSVSDHVDTRSAMGRFVLRLAIDLACLERETTVERTIHALGHKIKAGTRVGNVRYGYDLADDGKTLIPNEDEQATIRLMQKLRADGLSYEKIAAELDAHSVPTKEGGPWHYNSVARILKRQPT
jgi:DNA invertase Pin-like site-specific DNA recombinase